MSTVNTDPRTGLPRETTKQRQGRIPLDYYKYPSGLTRWRGRLGWLAVAVAGIWVVDGFIAPDGSGEARFSHGPVASVHAMWEQRCETCHEPFRPVNDRTWLAQAIDPEFDTTRSQRCEACHPGPAHNAVSVGVGSCGGCHRDHRGREVSLVRVADAVCTDCHRDLPARHVAGTTSYQNVADWASHPEFRPATTEPVRTLKFNHQRHMTAGQVKQPGDRGGWTYARITDPAERARYRAGDPLAASDADPVRLSCASCHRQDASDFRLDRGSTVLAGLPQAAVLPSRAAAEGFLPMTFENQCQACHPLTIDRGLKQPPLTVPHRLNAEQMKDRLWQMLAADVLKKDAQPLDAPFVRRPRPDQLPPAETKPLRAALEERLARVGRDLYGQQVCGKCHDPADPVARNDAPFDVKPVRIPDFWFAHARFDHRSHRAVDCRGCHAGAFVPEEGGVTETLSARPRLVPGIENCRLCHGPATLADGLPRGGVVAECVTCHRYHHGLPADWSVNRPLPGLGAAARMPSGRPASERTIDEFLRGFLPR